MTELPKPPRRGPKPRKPLPRVHAGGKRSRVSDRRQEQKRLKNLHYELWAFIIRSRFGLGPACQSPREHKCTRLWQAAHGFGKKVYPATKYELWNGLCLCSGEHSYYTPREPEWQAYLRELWGEDLYRERLIQAKTLRKWDHAEEVDVLRSIIMNQMPGFVAEAQVRRLM